jgi:hypothetical protein
MLWLCTANHSHSVSAQRQCVRTAKTQLLRALCGSCLWREARVIPCAHGIPWLGFCCLSPRLRRVKRRNVVNFSRRLRERWAERCAGKITFAEFAPVQGWINHVRCADSRQLREHVPGKELVFQKPLPKNFRGDCACGAVRDGDGNRR